MIQRMVLPGAGSADIWCISLYLWTISSVHLLMKDKCKKLYRITQANTSAVSHKYNYECNSILMSTAKWFFNDSQYCPYTFLQAFIVYKHLFVGGMETFITLIKKKYFNRLHLSHEVKLRELKETQDRPERERWRFRALDNFVPHRQTQIETLWAPDGAKKLEV